jgi:hypothetical protein
MTTLIDKLEGTHTEIEKLARDVASSIRDDDRECMRDDFAVLERRLLDHMSWEEMYILPDYEKQLPESAARIRAEHADFRARLGEIGLAIDLHSVRADQFDALAERLRVHADREDELYKTVAAGLPGDAATAVSSRYDRLLSLVNSWRQRCSSKAADRLGQVCCIAIGGRATSAWPRGAQIALSVSTTPRLITPSCLDV